MGKQVCPICNDSNYQLTQNGICASCEVHLLDFVKIKMEEAQRHKDAASHAELPQVALQEWKACAKVYQEVRDRYRFTGIDPFFIFNSSLSLRSVQDECLLKINYYEKLIADSAKSAVPEPATDSPFSFCPYCGNQLSGNFAFCPFCGKAITSSPQKSSENAVTSTVNKIEENLINNNDNHSSYSPPWEPTVQSSSCNTPCHEPEKKKSGCLLPSLIILCCAIFAVPFLSSGSGDNTQTTSPSTSETSESLEESNGKIIFSEPYHPLYEQAYQNAAIAVKKYLSNPDSAYLKHNYSKFHISTGKFYNYGDITYKNSSGIEVKEPFETCIMITDKKVYPLYVKLGNNVLLDDRDIVNDLGVVTAAGDSKYSNLKQGTVFYEGELIADWDENKMAITYDEYNQIKNGMDYSQVSQIVGSYGTEMSRVNVSGYESVVIAWDGIGSIGANANVTFQGGNVVAKAQFGLQ